MIIESLDLQNFRNYESLHLDFTDGITIFCGDNAQGKTNILEAVYLCAVNKSHRGAKDKEMIRFHEEEAHVRITVKKEETQYRVDLHLRKNKNKGLAVNLVPVRKIRDYLGMINCVFFSPEDLQIVKEGPSERRRFLDEELCQLDKIYLNSYVQYKKALEQRNQLLKDIFYEPSLRETLDVWDEQLIRYGTEIIERRALFVKRLNELSSVIHRNLSGGREELQLLYEPDCTAEEFREKMRASRERDIASKTTQNGPHRDDLAFLITEKDADQPMDARIYGSQGQKRTSALSAKLAEITLVKEKTGDTPVLLLDDVLSELDSGRQQFLLNSIENVQTFITCTGLEDFVSHRSRIDHIYYVEKGTVTRGE